MKISRRDVTELLITVGLIIAILFSVSALEAQTVSAPGSDQLSASDLTRGHPASAQRLMISQSQIIEEQSRLIEELRQKLEGQIRRLETLESQVAKMGGASVDGRSSSYIKSDRQVPQRDLTNVADNLSGNPKKSEDPPSVPDKQPGIDPVQREYDLKFRNFGVNLYGFFYGQWTHDTNGNAGPSIIWASSDAAGRNFPAETFVDVRSTRLGMNFISQRERAGWRSGGQLEADFDTASGAPRIRHAFLRVERGASGLIAGQTWQVVSQLNPDTVNFANLLGLGNLYERTPQVRFWRDLVSADRGYLRLDVGGLVQHQDLGQVVGGAGIRIPGNLNYQLRLSGEVASPWNSERKVLLGVSGGVTRIAVADASERRGRIPHSVFAGELLIPFRHFALSGKSWAGKGIGFGTGAGQFAVVTAPGAFAAVPAHGGWAQVQTWFHLARRDFTLNGFYGLDNPADVVASVALPIRKNSTVGGNLFVKLTEAFMFAPEVQYVRTERITGTNSDFRSSVGFFYSW